MFDFFLQRQRVFPIDLRLQAEHDCSDERISAVGDSAHRAQQDSATGARLDRKHPRQIHCEE
jgi:hypothetical protein